MQTIERLDEMIEKAKLLPGVGERADRAADVFLDGGLVFQQYKFRQGKGSVDHWLYRSRELREPYTVSHAAKICNCADGFAPRDERYGKLCKHRLAVMYAIKLRDESLAEIADQLPGESGGMLRVTLIYGDSRTLYYVNGYRVNGNVEARLEHPKSGGLGWYQFQVDPIDVAKALAKVGWGVGSNTKQKGFSHTWVLAPDISEAMSLSVMRGVAGNVQERRDQNARFAELEAIEDLYYA